ncbi:MAG: hypothetical protein KF849_04120 [Rhizobiaceae bacterium]|nr:hypothetical protein [Rhizobiaceae bacterium]
MTAIGAKSSGGGCLSEPSRRCANPKQQIASGAVLLLAQKAMPESLRSNPMLASQILTFAGSISASKSECATNGMNVDFKILRRGGEFERAQLFYPRRGRRYPAAAGLLSPPRSLSGMAPLREEGNALWAIGRTVPDRSRSKRLGVEPQVGSDHL